MLGAIRGDAPRGPHQAPAGCLEAGARRVDRRANLVYDRSIADKYRHQALIDAPVEDVWAIVSDPHTHPGWWPDVLEVEVPDDLDEGGEYTRYSRRLGFLDAVDAVWIAERLDYLKEARFRCTLSGSYAHFVLTSAQDETFIEVETGMLPTNLRWRLAKAMSRSYFKGWLRDVLDALPGEVARRRNSWANVRPR